MSERTKNDRFQIIKKEKKIKIRTFLAQKEYKQSIKSEEDQSAVGGSWKSESLYRWKSGLNARGVLRQGLWTRACTSPYVRVQTILSIQRQRREETFSNRFFVSGESQHAYNCLSQCSLDDGTLLLPARNRRGSATETIPVPAGNLETRHSTREIGAQVIVKRREYLIASIELYQRVWLEVLAIKVLLLWRLAR